MGHAFYEGTRVRILRPASASTKANFVIPCAPEKKSGKASEEEICCNALGTRPTEAGRKSLTNYPQVIHSGSPCKGPQTALSCIPSAANHYMLGFASISQAQVRHQTQALRQPGNDKLLPFFPCSVPKSIHPPRRMCARLSRVPTWVVERVTERGRPQGA